MKKIILFLSLVLFVTGCTAEYNIDIDNYFYETVSVYPKSDDESKRLSEYTYREPAFYSPSDFEDELQVLPDIERYDTSFSNNVYTASYRFGTYYQKSGIANSSVNRFYAVNGYKSIIYASDFSPIFALKLSLSSIRINIKTNKEVLVHNADSVNGNIYTWNINKTNPNRTINFQFINSNYASNHSPSSGSDFDTTKKNKEIRVSKDSKKNETSTSSYDVNLNQDNTQNDKDSSKRNDIFLYILYILFFSGIFVIIVFRNKFK